MHRSTKIAIIGAGFAGAATSYYLHQAGFSDHVIFEAEDLPGTRSSGLNAAMGRQVISDEIFRIMAMDGIRFLREPPEGFSNTPLIDNRGSVLCFASADFEKAQQLCNDARRDGIVCEFWNKERLRHSFPLMQEVDCAIFTPTDGLIDIHALLYAYLKPARHLQQLHTNTRVLKLSHHNSRWEIVTSQGDWTADIVINAAGAWAGELACAAGAAPMAFQIRRRHLFVTAPTAAIPCHWPFVWDLSHHYYFRPESGGVMISACDEDETTANGAFITSDSINTLMMDKMGQYCSIFTDIPIVHRWAGARTFSQNNKPVVCWDSQVPNFLWVAALGGHGATTSAAIGRQAASLVLRP